jgi:hypothetical protein
VVHANLPVHERELVGSPLLIQRLILLEFLEAANHTYSREIELHNI